MEQKIGAIVEGKVTGLTKFGAFVSLPDGSSGLVHISEIANTYVNDVHDYLQEGQTVKVKIIGCNEAGKINLSIKQASPPVQRQPAGQRPSFAPKAASSPKAGAAPIKQYDISGGELHGPSGDASFEDKLKHFMQESDSRMSGNKLYADRKSSGRRRK